MKKIKLYGREGCGFCYAARELLDDKEIEYEYIDVYENGFDFEALMKKTRLNTVPQIFIDNKCIGGYTELQELEDNEKLQPMLQE